MSKIVPVRFQEEEYLRMMGASAKANMPLSGYIRWLISGQKQTGGENLSQVLGRLDDLLDIVSSLKNPTAPPALPSDGLDQIDKKAFAAKLRERGVPSGVIRQVEAVLDEMGGK